MNNLFSLNSSEETAQQQLNVGTASHNFFSKIVQLQKVYTEDRRQINSTIEATATKGVFLNSERVWTTYRRNYMEVNVLLKYSEPPKYVEVDGNLCVPSHYLVGINAKSKRLGEEVELLAKTTKRDSGPSEPPSLKPIIPSSITGDSGVHNIQNIVCFNRLHLRTQTGKKTNQSLNYLIITIYGVIGGMPVALASCQSRAMLVRSRSKKHYAVGPIDPKEKVFEISSPKVVDTVYFETLQCSGAEKSPVDKIYVPKNAIDFSKVDPYPSNLESEKKSSRAEDPLANNFSFDYREEKRNQPELRKQIFNLDENELGYNSVQMMEFIQKGSQSNNYSAYQGFVRPISNNSALGNQKRIRRDRNSFTPVDNSYYLNGDVRSIMGTPLLDQSPQIGGTPLMNQSPMFMGTPLTPQLLDSFNSKFTFQGPTIDFPVGITDKPSDDIVEALAGSQQFLGLDDFQSSQFNYNDFL